MWQAIKKYIPNLKPEAFLADMELAAIKTFLDVFGKDIPVVACFFHWRKALREQLSKKNALEDVNECSAMNKMYRLCVSLAFVPLNWVVEVGEKVIFNFVRVHKAQLSDDTIAWIDYFVDTYLGQVYNQKICHCSGRKT